jgi:uncharacterized membrane protein YphA (DoxX/SURF4 family)
MQGARVAARSATVPSAARRLRWWSACSDFQRIPERGAAEMKVAGVVVRVLLGLLFLFASITYWFELITPPPMTGAIQTFNDGLEASVYLMPLVKSIELVCGIAFVVGRFVPLATVLIAPIIVNIVCVHAFMAPDGLPVALFAALANAFVAYQHRGSYAPLFEAKAPARG